MQASWGVHIMGVHLTDVSLSRACISGACISKGLHLSYELYEPLKIDLGDFRFWPLGSLGTGSGTTPRTHLTPQHPLTSHTYSYNTASDLATYALENLALEAWPVYRLEFHLGTHAHWNCCLSEGTEVVVC